MMLNYFPLLTSFKFVKFSTCSQRNKTNLGYPWQTISHCLFLFALTIWKIRLATPEVVLVWFCLKNSPVLVPAYAQYILQLKFVNRNGNTNCLASKTGTRWKMKDIERIYNYVKRLHCATACIMAFKWLFYLSYQIHS